MPKICPKSCRRGYIYNRPSSLQELLSELTITTATTMTKTTMITIDNYGDYFWFACLYNRREGKRITTTMTAMTTTTTMTTATTIDDDVDHLLG